MSTESDDALEQIANAPDHEEGVVEPVEIELTDEDMGGQTLADFVVEEPAAAVEPPAAAEDPPAAPRERQPRAQVRIEALTAERDAATARAAELEARATQAAQRSAEAEHAAIYHYHGKLTTEAESLRGKLLEAKRNGETETEIDLQTKLNLVSAELNNAAEALQSAPPRAAPVEAPRPAPVSPPAAAPAQAEMAPETAAWIGRNAWFQNGSPAYDAEMADEARLFARRVERRLTAEGRAADIGRTPAYWMEIDRHLRTEFPDAFDDPVPTTRGVPPMSRDATVAPVQRGGAPAPGAPTGNKVRLSAEERSFAHQMAANGAFRKNDGSRPSAAEAERMFAAQKLKTGARA